MVLRKRPNSRPSKITKLWVCYWWSVLHLRRPSASLSSASFSPLHHSLSLSLSFLSQCASTDPLHLAGNLHNHPYAERLWVNALASAINSSFECLKCRVGKLHPVTCARGWLRNATAAGNAFHDGNHWRSYASSETLRDDLFLIFFQIITFIQDNREQYHTCDYLILPLYNTCNR